MVRAGALRGYAELVRSLGGDAEALLREHGIEPHRLANEDALVSLRTMIQLLDSSAQRLRCPEFGLRLAQFQSIDILGPLAVAMQNLPTVRDALSYGANHLFAHGAGIEMTVFDKSPAQPKCSELRYEIVLPRVPVIVQPTDLSLGLAHRVLQLFAREHYRLEEVHLSYKPPAPLETYKRFFGAKVRIEQAHACLLVSPSSFSAPMRTVNPLLRQLAMTYLDAQFPAPGRAVSARARQAITQTLGTRSARKEGVAQMLAMHPRTLQRRLSAEGTTFDEVYDAVCRDTALRYLSGTRMPLTQIAALIGLARQSALTRACQRWFGVPPSVVRKRGIG